MASSNSNKVFYTDGHEVIVTDTTFKVNKREYKLLGITRHGLLTIKPHRAPGIFIMVIGLLVLVIGAYELLPANSVPDVRLLNRWISANDIAVFSGGIIALAGALYAILVKPKYAVRISTAEGESNAVISEQQEYIRQIIDGLNRAFIARGVKA
jgi:hypothetical protein